MENIFKRNNIQWSHVTSCNSLWCILMHKVVSGWIDNLMPTTLGAWWSMPNVIRKEMKRRNIQHRSCFIFQCHLCVLQRSGENIFAAKKFPKLHRPSEAKQRLALHSLVAAGNCQNLRRAEIGIEMDWTKCVNRYLVVPPTSSGKLRSLKLAIYE
jgi:hypothetical protein